MSVNTKGNERDNQAVEETGRGCEGSECLQILKELRELHQDNLRRIDDELGRDGTEIKLKAMQSWIFDLEEQHAVFLQTMVQLEQEAVDRVSLLQEGLHRSSQAALAYRTKLDDYDKDDFVERVVSSARSEQLQHTQIQKLQSDITNLLELIRRVRDEDSWDASGLTFNEVTFEDIFGTDVVISGHMDGAVHDSQIATAISISVETTQSTDQNRVCAVQEICGKDAVITDLNDESLRLYLDLDKCKDDKGREVSKMKEEILTLKFDIKRKDEQIQRFERSIEAFHNNIHNKLNEVSIERQSQCGSAVNEQNCDELLRCSLQGLDELFQRAQEEKEEFTAEVTQVKTELKESKAKIEQLAKTVNDMNQSNKDIRESLTAEVAAKHDEIVDLRRMNRSLEERCRETEMMVLLKDDIIKELRKDLKASGFKHVSCSADRKNVVNNSQQEEQSLRNVSRHADNNPNDNQQVQAPDNKPDYQLKQVPASPDEPQHSFSCQYHSTPKKSSMFCSRKKVYDVGNTDETKHQSACDRSLSLEHSNWSYILNATDEWSADGSYHKEKNNVDTAEHLKNLILISDNTIKKQQENINGLYDIVKKYESDISDLQTKAEHMEVELKDSKLKYIQQITDQDAMINDLQKTMRTSQTEVEMLKEKCDKYERSAEAVQEERENLKTEMEKLQNNLSSREKVAANQEEIINILQDSVNIAQKEQQDLQQKLKDSEAGKEKLLNTLQEERKKAENLQEALMVTKQQLEDLQGNKYEVSVNSGMSWGWSHTSRSGHVNKRTVHDI